jgi:hypothetical protein
MKTLQLKTVLEDALQVGTLVRIKILPMQSGNLKFITVRPLIIKNNMHLSFTYSNETNDIVKNFSPADAWFQIESMISELKQVYVFTTHADFIFSVLKDSILLKQQPPTFTTASDLKHNQKKNYTIAPEATYLKLLKVTGANNQVLSQAYHKYKQINQYINLLQPLFAIYDKTKDVQITDMGCGKGYLTFALYDFLLQTGFKPNVTGIELRKDLVVQCNRIAQECNYQGLKFIHGSIDQATITPNMLIALHACNTATDEAIFMGIKNNCNHIIVAPCCHKQIRQAMHATDSALKYILSYGIYKERMAETITDVLRMLYLNACGYETKAVEFIADIHTPKNVMIIATKKQTSINEAAQKILNIKSMYGIEYHALELMLKKNNLLPIV